MCTSRYAYQAPSSMLRARRKDANVRPNRWLDKKSSRGMLFENEELRLRTIEINAEVERGQGDIKKLKRQNEQLRREIWTLRDEYDKLEERMRQMRGDDEYLDEEEELGDEEEEIYDSDDETNIKEKKCDDEDADNIQNAHLASAKLLGLREEGAGCEASAPSPLPPEPPPNPPPLIEEEEETNREPKDKPDLIVLSQQNTKEVIHRRDSIRRRTFGGEIPTATEPSPAGVRLSLPVSGECRDGAGDLLNQQQVNENSVLGTTSEPWWLLASVEPEMSSTGYQPSSPPAVNTPWTPQSDRAAAWAITPFNQNQQPTFPARFRRRAPPPPPPKPPSCEQVTVRRASSVLPDGTTRRSVTFHADSVTYIPPTTQQCVYIPANCVCDHQDDKQEEGETRLLVRGLDRVPGMAPRELIDALEQRLGEDSLREAVRGVCLHHQARPAVAATVSVGQRDVALRLLAAGLEARGEALEIEEENTNLSPSRWQPHGDVSDPSHVLLVSGVTHKVSDAAVRAAVMRACGLRASHVCRHVYKGVDTGERLVRVTTGCPSLALQQPETTESTPTENCNEASSESKFRSHLKVKLKAPGSKPTESPPATRPTKLKIGSNVPPPPPPRAPSSTPQQTPATPTPPSPKIINNGPVLSPPPYTAPPPPTSRAQSITRTEGEIREESPKQQRGSVSFENPPGGAVVTAQPVTSPHTTQSVRKKASSAQQNGGILRKSDDAHNPMRRAGKSRSVSVESSRVPNPQRRRHGVFERPSEDLLLEARGSFDDTPRTLHIPPKGPALPWCACWGNGCI